jgi:hypothetical protein
VRSGVTDLYLSPIFTLSGVVSSTGVALAS